MDSHALEQYQRTRIETGSPARLVAMLYDGALRFLGEARDAIEQGDIPVRADRIRKVLHIVQELANALDYEVESDLPERLAALYEYVEYELLEASRQNSTVPLDNASRVLENLAGAWRELADRNVEAEAPAPPKDPATAPTHEPDVEESSLPGMPENVSLSVSA